MQICLAWRSICTLRVGGNLWDIITHFSNILLSLGSTGFYVTICSFTRVSFVCFSLYNHSRTTPLPCLPQATPKWIKVLTDLWDAIRSCHPKHGTLERVSSWRCTDPSTYTPRTWLKELHWFLSFSFTTCQSSPPPLSLFDAFKHSSNFTIPVVQSQTTQKEMQDKKPPYTRCK